MASNSARRFEHAGHDALQMLSKAKKKAKSAGFFMFARCSPKAFALPNDWLGRLTALCADGMRYVRIDRNSIQAKDILYRMSDNTAKIPDMERTCTKADKFLLWFLP